MDSKLQLLLNFATSAQMKDTLKDIKPPRRRRHSLYAGVLEANSVLLGRLGSGDLDAQGELWNAKRIPLGSDEHETELAGHPANTNNAWSTVVEKQFSDGATPPSGSIPLQAGMQCQVCERGFEHANKPDDFSMITAAKGVDGYKCYYHEECWNRRSKIDIHDILGTTHRCDACGLKFQDDSDGNAPDKITASKGEHGAACYFHESCWPDRDNRRTYKMCGAKKRCFQCGLGFTVDDSDRVVAINRWETALRTHTACSKFYFHQNCWSGCQARERYELYDGI